jgi:hypothetical protein
VGWLGRFARFWYDFLVGDDWLAAVLVGVALGATAVLADGYNPWWLLPVAIAAILVVSVRRAAAAATRHPRSSDTEPLIDL